MLSVFIFIFTFALGFAKIIALTWVFYLFRKLAAIAYLTYLIVMYFYNGWFIQKMMTLIQNNQVMLWLGKNSAERVTNSIFLMRFLPSFIETILFIWLILSLSKRHRST